MMMKQAERFRCTGAARGWPLIWLSVMLVAMKLIAALVAVDHALTEPFEFVPQPHFILL